MTDTRRARMREAHESARLTLEDRRLKLAEDISDAERLREQLWRPSVVYDFTKDGRFATGELAEPTFSDKRNILASVAHAVEKMQLLTGGATSREEVWTVDRIDAEVSRLARELGERAAQGGGLAQPTPRPADTAR